MRIFDYLIDNSIIQVTIPTDSNMIGGSDEAIFEE